MRHEEPALIGSNAENDKIVQALQPGLLRAFEVNRRFAEFEASHDREMQIGIGLKPDFQAVTSVGVSSF